MTSPALHYSTYASAPEERYPESRDPRWERIAEPVLVALRVQPLTARQLKDLRPGRLNGDAVINAIAWLALNGKAYFDPLTKRWVHL